MAAQGQQMQFSEQDQRELAQFLEAENAKARIQQTVHEMTDVCWNKCIFKINNKMDRSDESCLANCVERFLDTSMFIVKRLEDLRSSAV
ncbi:Tim10/DDP family zinc finger-domain-containing protein [Dichotomocladium elegans]|nr:Tim10/DDP family zinc finger-domain-containing protein [Dichotomocladium elegans]